MKALILVLSVLWTAQAVQAQSIADVARRERERQRQTSLRSIRIFTTEDARSATGAEDVKAAAAKPVDNSKPPSAPAAPQVKPLDPAQQYREETDKLRVRIRELQDQDVALQLQVNEASNLLFAPVTDQATQSAAQAKLAQTQNQLIDVRQQLDLARKALSDMEAKGAPK